MFATGSQDGWTLRRNSFFGTGTGAGAGLQTGILVVPYAQSNSASPAPIIPIHRLPVEPELPLRVSAPAVPVAATSQTLSSAADRNPAAMEVSRPALQAGTVVQTVSPVVETGTLAPEPVSTGPKPIFTDPTSWRIPPVPAPPASQPPGLAQSGGIALRASLDSALIEQNVFTGLSVAALILATSVGSAGGTVAHWDT